MIAAAGGPSLGNVGAMNMDMALQAPGSPQHAGKPQGIQHAHHQPPVDGVDEPQRAGRSHHHGEVGKAHYQAPVDGFDEPARASRAQHDLHKAGMDGVDRPGEKDRVDRKKQLELDALMSAFEECPKCGKPRFACACLSMMNPAAAMLMAVSETQGAQGMIKA